MSTAGKVDRRALHWEKIRGPRAYAAFLVSTWFGSGLLPKAPGTWGTLFAIPVAWALSTAEAGDAARLALWASLFLIGTWAAGVFDETMGTADNQNVVVDEVVGYGITAWTIGTDWPSILAAFVLFRFFDMVKPWPIRLVDRWSHRRSKGGDAKARARWTGFGVMADDVLAGVFGLACVVALQKTGVLPS
jgi:phosphatidylglycerophosphatase A